jgi:beta-1,4-galactosyltransferase 1
MSVAVNEMNYKLQYEELVGGVLILRPEHVLSVNGYSNLYWGWGAEGSSISIALATVKFFPLIDVFFFFFEDDDLYYRIKGTGLNVERPPVKLARYTMIKHEKRKPQVWSKRQVLLKANFKCGSISYPIRILILIYILKSKSKAVVFECES